MSRNLRFIIIGVIFLVLILTGLSVYSYYVIKSEDIYIPIIITNSIISIGICFIVYYLSTTINKSLNDAIEINTLITEKSYEFTETIVMYYNSENTIIWINKYGRDIFLKNNYIGKNIESILLEKKDQKENKFSNTRLFTTSVQNNVFQGIHYPEFRVILLKNSTKLSNIVQKFDEEYLGMGIILLDNYINVLNSSNEIKIVTLNREIKGRLLEWATLNNLFLKNISEERILIIGNKKSFQNVEKDNSIQTLIHSISKIRNSLKVNVNITMGIAYGINDPIKLYDTATDNLDIGLSRGGDQAIISNYIGNDQTVISASKNSEYDSKSRTKIKYFWEEARKKILDADNIIISGHHWADYDAIGSSLGIFILCNSLGKEANIFIDWESVDKIAKNKLEEYIPKSILKKYENPKKLNKFITSNTLAIICDTSLKERTEIPKIFDNHDIDKIIIDHHRVGSNYEKYPTSYIDTYSSSTSEIVGEILKFESEYNSKLFIEPAIATLLLTGIMLDSNNLSVRTTRTTYNVASFLTSQNASLSEVKFLLKPSKEDTIIKSKIMDKMEEYKKGIVIAVAPNKLMIDRSIMAMAAQEMINISDVYAAFVIAYDKNQIACMSARSSSNDFNVQIIAESLNGGGHFTASAAQAQNGENLEEFCNLLKAALKKYLKNTG